MKIELEIYITACLFKDFDMTKIETHTNFMKNFCDESNKTKN